MAVIETWFEQDLQKPVKVRYIDGNLFSHNDSGNRIGVVVTNNGEAVTLTGTVSGYAVLADGTTVPCTGTRSGNKASILVPAAAYSPGSILISIFLTDGTTVTTLAALSFSVIMARTGNQIDPGSVVTDWTNTINAAMQSVETAAANLGNIVATPYANLTFPVPLGKYTIYNNGLYRCISPIASSEAWTAAHWKNVKLGDDVADLKRALDNTSNVLKTIKKNLGNVFIASDGVITSGGAFKTIALQVLAGSTISIHNTASNMSYAFYTIEPEIGVASYNNSRTLSNSGTVEDITVPSNCSWIAVRTDNTGDVNITPASYVLDNLYKVIFKVPTGKGSDSVDIPTNTDLDNITDNGIYYLAGGTYPHSPFASGQYAFLLNFVSNVIKMQICIGYNTRTKIYVRDFGARTWHEWKEYDTSNIIDQALIPKTVNLTETNLNNVFGNNVWLMSDEYQYTNKPSGLSSNVGFLQVVEVANGYAIQLLYQFTGGKVWKRRGKNGTTPTWEEWQEIDGGNIINDYTFNTYSQEVTLTASPEITSDTNNYLAPTGDTTDRTADILAMLTATGICRLGAGDYYISNLQMPDGSSIIGSGYPTKVYLAGTSNGFAIKLGSHCMVENISLLGANSDLSFSASEGERHGILWAGNYTESQTAPFRGIVNNVFIQRFSGGGIKCYDTGYGTTNMIEVTNAFIRNCWAGIVIAYWSEFHKFTNVRCDGCRIGCVNNGGNNVFVNCDFSKNLEIAMLMDNSQNQSPNNSHGSCIGCVFNHTESNGVVNSGIGIEILNCGSGFIFSGCQVFFSKIHLEDSPGIVFANCNFGYSNCDIEVSGGKGILFSGNIHQNKSPITISNGAEVHFVNCYNRTTGALIEP